MNFHRFSPQKIFDFTKQKEVAGVNVCKFVKRNTQITACDRLMKLAFRFSLVALGFVFVWHFYSRPPSFRSFGNKDDAYYAKVATGCDELLERFGAKNLMARTNIAIDGSLPLIISELRPSEIGVASNGVFISRGIGGRDAYGIIWASSENDPSLWKLSIVIEGFERHLYSKNNFGAD